MKRTILNFNQKLSIVQHLTQGKGPLVAMAEGSIQATTTEYERHLRCVHHNLEVFDVMVWQPLIAEFGVAVVEEAANGKAGLVV